MAHNTSPAVDVPSRTPTEEEDLYAASLLVSPTTSHCKLQQPREDEQADGPPEINNCDITNLDPADEPVSKVSWPPEESFTAEPASLAGSPPAESSAQLSVPHQLSIGQKIIRDDNDLRVYKTEERKLVLPKHALLQGNTKKYGSSWNWQMHIEVNKVLSAVKVHIFLIPRVGSSGTEKTELYVMAEVTDRKLRSLQKCNEECWVLVETELMDQDNGKRIGSTHFTPQAVSMDDGKVNFHQDLVCCDEIKNSTSDPLNLRMKVTFIICPLGDHGFIKVETPEDYQEIEKQQ